MLIYEVLNDFFIDSPAAKIANHTILAVVYLIFLILAYRNVAKFYNALGHNQDETALFNALGVLAYFHLKGRMKEELKGIR